MERLPKEIIQKIKESKRASIFSIASNSLLAIIKWLAGIFGNSYALIADAIESTADVLSSIIVLFANKYSYKPADTEHPYGHGRMEVIATFVVVVFLIASAVIIAIQSIENIITPPQAPKAFTLVILTIIIIWKEGSYQYVVRKAERIGSSSLKADAWHHRSDAITSVAAFIGISIALYFGYRSADAWAALFASFFILYNSYLILKPAIGEIMDKDTYQQFENKIREKSKLIEGVKDIEKCYIRKSGMFYFVDLHVVVDANMTVLEGHNIGHKVKVKLIEYFPDISNVMTHVEPYNPLKTGIK